MNIATYWHGPVPPLTQSAAEPIPLPERALAAIGISGLLPRQKVYAAASLAAECLLRQLPLSALLKDSCIVLLGEAR